MPKIFSSAGFGNSSLRTPAPGPYHHLALANEYRGNRGCGSGSCESEPDMGEVYIPRGLVLCSVFVRPVVHLPPPLSLSPPLRALQVSCHRHTKPRALIFALNLKTFLCPLLFLLPSLLCSLSFVFCLLASVRFRSIHFFASVIIDTVYPPPAGRTDREGQDETIGKKRIENRKQERRTRQAFYLYPSERS